MKVLKIILVSILLIFITTYLAFLFMLPNTINLNRYAPQMTKIIQDNIGFRAELNGLKLKTAWNLSAGAMIDKIDLKYSTGEKFAQINGMQIRLSLIPFLFGNIKIDKVDVDKILLNIELDKKGDGHKMNLGRNYSHRLITTQSNYFKNLLISQTFNCSANMPNISVKKYRISLLSGSNNYTLKGEDLKISDFVLNKKIKLKTEGGLILNGKKQISYNISVFSKVLPKLGNRDIMQSNIIKVFEDLHKYNAKANINADLKIGNKFNIDGEINLDNILFTLGGKTFPQSDLKLNFSGNRVKIDSNFYTDVKSKALITGLFKFSKNGEHKSVDLQVLSEHTNIENTVLMAKTILRTFGMKNLDKISASGFAKANFSLKSDFKKIQSNGYLQIKDTNITDKLRNISLNSINADVDFSQNAVQIKQAKAKFNGQPINIIGIVDKNANADISVFAEKLQLKGVLLTSGNAKILKENDILSGKINIKANLKGRLDKAIPKINVIISNVNLKNKKTKTQIKLAKAVINTGLLKNTGKAELTDFKIIPNFSTIISIPKINLTFDKQDLIMEKTYLYVGNIKTNFSGKIVDLNLAPHLKSVNINIPNQISVPIAGYSGSNIAIKGDLTLDGDLNNPEIKGLFIIPLIRVPSASAIIKNTTLKFDKNININCSQVQIFGITSSNITSDVIFKNNFLYLSNLRGDAYFGKIGGNINYDLKNKKTILDLQGRNLSANPAMIGLTGRDNDINGKLDFDTNVSMIGNSRDELLHSVKGKTNFIISNGEMGVLGKFEHLLYAQNVISNNVFKTTLNVVVKAITVKNTGVYKYMKGKIEFSNGWANVDWIKTSGPSMSLYITGRCYLPDNTANLIILGRISDDVVRILGPIGEFSMDKAISYIPKIGEITSFFASQFTVNPDYENTSMIPYLTPKTEFQTKEFKVLIDGEIQKQNSVKSFKWISRPMVVPPMNKQYISPYQAPTGPANPSAQVPAQIPDFVKKLPNLKN